MNTTTTRTLSRIALTAVVAALAGILLSTMLLGTSAAQVDPYGGGKPTVLPTRIDRDKSTPAGTKTPDEEPTVQGIRFSDDGPETLPSADTKPGLLPFTGGDVLPYVLVAIALIGGGFVLVRRVRTGRTDVG